MRGAERGERQEQRKHREGHTGDNVSDVDEAREDSLTSCMTIGKFLKLSVPLLPIWKME